LRKNRTPSGVSLARFGCAERGKTQYITEELFKDKRQILTALNENMAQFGAKARPKKSMCEVEGGGRGEVE